MGSSTLSSAHSFLRKGKSMTPIVTIGIDLAKNVLAIHGVDATGKPLSARLIPMNARVEHVLDEALALPADERSAVAVALLDSLDDADSASMSDAWREEVKRRREELHSGAVRAVPWSEVKQRLGSL